MHSEHDRCCGLGMDALVIGTRPLLWFGHGCSSCRMLWEHERYYGSGMKTLVIVCTGNTNAIVAWAWMLWLSDALGTRRLLWFGHGCSSYRMLWEHKRYYGLGMKTLVIVCTGNTNDIVVWAWMLWLSYALGTRPILWFGHGCSGDGMLWEHERYCGLGIDALAIGRTRNTNVIIPLPPAQPPNAKLRKRAKVRKSPRVQIHAPHNFAVTSGEDLKLAASIAFASLRWRRAPLLRPWWSYVVRLDVAALRK